MLATISPKGQITIPQALREQLGLLPAMQVEITATPEGFLLITAQHGESKGQRALRLLRQAKSNGMTTEEIMAMTRGWGDPDEDRAHGINA